VNSKGKLYLIPCPLGENAAHTIPAYVIDILHSLDVFIAERAKTARAFIKTTQQPIAFSDMTVFELNKRTPIEEWKHFLAPALEGKNIGLISEAGCPGIADPGAVIVAMAHKKEIEVVPLVGPSSILLALIASGMNGQEFSFHGYLSVKAPELARDLKHLQQQVIKTKATHIFMETPYRNNGLVDQLIKTIAPHLRLCIATDISLPTQFIKTKKIEEWAKIKRPDLHKRPTVFLLGV